MLRELHDSDEAAEAGPADEDAEGGSLMQADEMTKTRAK